MKACAFNILMRVFHGLAGEDPHKHLKEFHILCSTMKSPDVQEDHIFLRRFSWRNSSLHLGPLPSLKTFQASGNFIERAYISTGKDSRNCVQAVLTTRFLSNSFFNISMRDLATWRGV